MTDTDQTRTGGCRCGAVRYRAVGKPKWVAHCHCKDCRKQTSAGYATWLGYETTAVTWAKSSAIGLVIRPAPQPISRRWPGRRP